MRLSRGMLAQAVAGGASFCLPPTPLPSPREAHVWCVRPDEVKDNRLLDRYMDLLSPCEKRNVMSMRDSGLQKGALLARALVRSTLSRYTNGKVDPRRFEFSKSTFGKPEILRHPEDHYIPLSLQFNISHTSSLIACGIATVPIGIDIEEKGRRTAKNVMSVAQRYFSTAEYDYLAALSEKDAQLREFIKLWTLKESYVKATGRGFSGSPFKTFTIRLENNKFVLFLGDREKHGDSETGHNKQFSENWEFSLVELQNLHYLATCLWNDHGIGGERIEPLKLTIRRTIPFVEDHLVSATEVQS